MNDSIELNHKEQDAYDAILEKQATARAKIQQLEDFKSRKMLNFGQVKMESGPRDGHKTLDWAICEPKKERIGGNIIPSQGILDNFGTGAFVINKKTHVGDFTYGPLEAGDMVFKTGRTTGLTVGVVHAIPTIRKHAWPMTIPRGSQPFEFAKSIPGSMALPSDDGHGAGMPTQLVETYVIKGYRSKPFHEQGDSGAWILDYLGDLVALLWGGCTGSDDCYYTPIKDIVNDIEKYTGKKVDMYTGT